MSLSGLAQWFAGGFSTDLMEQLTFYGAYHANPTNQLIHIIFVPLIWFTAAIWLAYFGPACKCHKMMILTQFQYLKSIIYI
jgi:uncharacterized membrane protein YGL010W